MTNYSSDEAILNGEPLTPSSDGTIAPRDGNANTGARHAVPLQTPEPGADRSHLFGLNNERLEELRPDLVNALRELEVQYRQEGIVARRHEIRRIRQARLFWQGLQYAWWNPQDMTWHLPYESKSFDDSAAAEMPRYQFVTNLYQAFGLSFISVISQDVPATRFYPQSAQSIADITTARAASQVSELVEQNNRVQHLLTGVAFYLWTDGKIGGYVRYVADAQRFGSHDEPVIEEHYVPLGEDKYVCPECGVGQASACRSGSDGDTDAAEDGGDNYSAKDRGSAGFSSGVAETRQAEACPTGSGSAGITGFGAEGAQAEASGFNVPLGWTPDATFFTGGSADTTGKAIWGGAYSILGDGATATRGLITQSAATDYNGAPRLQANTAYSARVRVRMTGTLTQGTLHVQIFSASPPISTTGVAVPAAQVTTTAWKEFVAPITPSTGFTSIPADLVLRVYADGTPTNGAGFLVENIEIFPTTEPYNTSLVRASFAEDPESYDGVSGFLNISEDDGQAVRAAFLLRERLYFVKERSIYVTADDGVNEPASWTINEVSRTVGTPSVAGVDTGEDWAVIAGRAGMYMFDGGEPVKISQEIQPLWDQINWAAGKTLWVRVDTRNKRILCGVPIGAATSPNRILVLDYRSLSSAGEIESLGSVLFSTLSGKLYAVGRSRKWCPWNITANCCTLAERSDGTSQVFLGNGAGNGSPGPLTINGKIYQLSDAQFSDDGAAINSYYTTYFFLSNDLEQTYQVRSHRKLFAYLTAYAEGAGNLNLSAFTGNEAYPTALAPLALSSPAPKDLEMPINLLGERVAFQVGTNAVGAWFKLERFVPSLLPDPWAPVRGGN
jgi:hypothetical protein